MTAPSADSGSPVRLRSGPAADQPDATLALEELYRGFERALLVPLWIEIGDLMPAHPQPAAVPHRAGVAERAWR
jgi:gentisate 1,2-dioxygenase